MHPDPSDLFQYRIECLDEYFLRPVVLGVYDVAAWLRQLLLDDVPLVDVVNKNLRVRLRFEVNTLPESVTANLKETNGLVHLGASLSPRVTQMTAPTRLLTRAQFLREPILLTGWERIPVRDLILWAANEAGGVHYDPKLVGTSAVLNRLMRAVDSPESPVLGSTIIGIAHVIRDAIEPIHAAIAARDV